MAGPPRKPLASKSVKAVRRVKTFSGCWTCRGRGVACDELRPICNRCATGGHACKGYGIKLIWEDERGTSLRCRRIIPRTSNSAVARMSEAEIDETLDQLETVQPHLEHCQGPFSVFPLARVNAGLVCHHSIVSLSKSSPSSPTVSSPETSTGDVIGTEIASAFSPVSALSPDTERLLAVDFFTFSQPFDEQAHNSPRFVDVSSEEYGIQEDDVLTPTTEKLLEAAFLEFAHTETIEAQRSAGQLRRSRTNSYATPMFPHIANSTLVGTEESGLVDFWVSHLSNIFLPTQRADNPFRSIYVPMVLSAAAEHRNKIPGHQALLHTVYAMSAFGRAQIGSAEDQQKYSLLGMKHHHKALGQLAKGLADANTASSRDAVLASIITLSSIDAISGDFSTWRLHVQGGREWLDALRRSDQRHSDNTAALLSIFLCIEAVALSGGRMNGRRFPGYNYASNSIFGLSETSVPIDHDVSSMLGITRPILEIMAEINHLVSQETPPTLEEVEALELKIVFNNPTTVRFRGLANPTEELVMKHHACSYYYACWIHHQRCLRGTPPKDLQHLVIKGLDHLDAIASFEESRNVSGMFWPTFIIACEAEGVASRQRVAKYFEKGKIRGIGNILSSSKVILELWRKRDEQPLERNFSWQDVKHELGLDLLLT